MLCKKLKIVVLKKRKVTLDFRRITYIGDEDDYLYDFPECDKKCSLDHYFTCSPLRRFYCKTFNRETLNIRYVV
jgi:hypothetical protein